MDRGLDIVNRTHLVLASGKPVLQKIISISKLRSLLFTRTDFGPFSWSCVGFQTKVNEATWALKLVNCVGPTFVLDETFGVFPEREFVGYIFAANHYLFVALTCQ